GGGGGGFGRKEQKKESALGLGGKNFYTEPQQCKKEMGFILSNIPTHYDLKNLLKLLNYNCDLAPVGLP
ncbi:hypothetical protein BZK27_08095, partial [Helicobacter pylori]